MISPAFVHSLQAIRHEDESMAGIWDELGRIAYCTCCNVQRTTIALPVPQCHSIYGIPEDRPPTTPTNSGFIWLCQPCGKEWMGVAQRYYFSKGWTIPTEGTS